MPATAPADPGRRQWREPRRTDRSRNSQLNETMTEQPFWKTKTLAEMSNVEWESLCDSCRCKDYENRQETVPDCIQLTLKGLREIKWLPPTCGYRLIDEGHDLYWWHPLVSGDPETVHEAGVSARGRTISEEGMDVEDLEDYVVDWPLKVGAERG